MQMLLPNVYGQCVDFCLSDESLAASAGPVNGGLAIQFKTFASHSRKREHLCLDRLVGLMSQLHESRNARLRTIAILDRRYTSQVQSRAQGIHHPVEIRDSR